MDHNGTNGFFIVNAKNKNEAFKKTLKTYINQKLDYSVSGNSNSIKREGFCYSIQKLPTAINGVATIHHPFSFLVNSQVKDLEFIYPNKNGVHPVIKACMEKFKNDPRTQKGWVL